MKNCSKITALLILLGLTICVPIPVVSVEPVPSEVPASGTFEKYGPRVDHLVFKVGAYWPELDWGEIDVMEGPVPHPLWNDWLADPKITMGEFVGGTIDFFALNNQMWPTGHGTKTPFGWTGSEPAVVTGHQRVNYTCQRCLDAREFRRALAHLTDKTLPWCFPAETFVPPMLQEWENPAAAKYPFNLTRAKEILNNAGFNDYDGDEMLEYSPSHTAPSPPTPPSDMEELPDLQLWIRVDDPDLKFAGELLRDEMRKLGIPLDAYIASRSFCLYVVKMMHNYHIYTDGLTLYSRDPSAHYRVFYKDYIGYYNPEFDYWFQKFRNATTMEEALEACYMFQEIIARDVASIPHHTWGGYTAHRTYYPSTAEILDLPAEEQKYSGRNWIGFVNEIGYGFYGYWSSLNVHPEGFDKGGTLRHGLLYDVVKFDPVDAELFDDWLVLSKVYEPLIVHHPYNATKYVPWLAKNYAVGEWAGPNGPASKVTFEIIPNILWHDNVPFTPYDAAFSYQYYKDTVSVPNSWAVVNFDHADYNATHVTFYFDIKTWLVLELCVLPIIPSHIWEPIPPTIPGDPTPGGSWAYNPEAEDTVIGTGPFRFAKDGVVGRVDRVPEYIHLEANPTYFRRYIWPDVCDATHTPCVTDGWVDLDDIMEIAKPGNFFAMENIDGIWPDPPGPWGEHCDVNKDGVIGVIDVMEVCLHLGEPWPPPWYIDY